jgi:hypothetical protein
LSTWAFGCTRACGAARDEADHYPAHMSIDPTPAKIRSTPRRRWVKRVAISLGVTLTILALLCCAGVGYVVYDGRRAPREEKAMEALAEDLCEALVSGDTDAVYAGLSAGARERYSVEELALGLAARARLTLCDAVHAT